jgi:2,3-bisphosphoglycerate-dependent phosphoglycerate mutase
MASKNLIVLAHCESCYNRGGIFTGRVDSKLTAKGHKHAERLARKLKNENIDIAYTSPLSRARKTLEYILKYHPKTRVYIDDRIIERDYGSLSHKKKAKFKREHPDLYPVYHRSYDVAPPEGESMKTVERRIRPFIKDIIKVIKKDKVDVLVVAHGNSIRPIKRYFEYLTPEQMMKIENLRDRINKYKIRIS